jgi:hypothetical protein
MIAPRAIAGNHPEALNEAGKGWDHFLGRGDQRRRRGRFGHGETRPGSSLPGGRSSSATSVPPWTVLARYPTSPFVTPLVHHLDGLVDAQQSRPGRPCSSPGRNSPALTLQVVNWDPDEVVDAFVPLRQFLEIGAYFPLTLLESLLIPVCSRMVLSQRSPSREWPSH